MKKYEKLTIPNDTAWDRKSIWRYLPYWLRDIFTGIKNLIKWAPTIYKQRDWDGAFIYDILQKKIEFQRKCLVDGNRHTRVELDHRDMTNVLNLIERVRGDYYNMEYMDFAEYEYSFGTKNGGNTNTLNVTVIRDDFDDFLNKYKSSVRQVIKKEGPIDDKETLCLHVSLYNQEKARKLLFKILNERIEAWWD